MTGRGASCAAPSGSRKVMRSLSLHSTARAGTGRSTHSLSTRCSSCTSMQIGQPPSSRRHSPPPTAVGAPSEMLPSCSCARTQRQPITGGPHPAAGRLVGGSDYREAIDLLAEHANRTIRSQGQRRGGHTRAAAGAKQSTVMIGIRVSPSPPAPGRLRLVAEALSTAVTSIRDLLIGAGTPQPPPPRD